MEKAIDLINSYSREGKINEAIALARKMLNNNPGDEKLSILLGSLYIGQGQCAEGIALCQKVFEANPDNAEACSVLGKGYLKKGDYKEAVVMLKRVVELEPENKQAHYQLGISYDHLRLENKAGEEYKKAHQLEKREEHGKDIDLKSNRGKV